MVILFPLGAMLMTMFGKWWIHAAFQTFSLVMLIVGFGLGVKLATFKDYVCIFLNPPLNSWISYGVLRLNGQIHNAIIDV